MNINAFIYISDDYVNIRNTSQKNTKQFSQSTIKINGHLSEQFQQISCTIIIDDDI